MTAQRTIDTRDMPPKLSAREAAKFLAWLAWFQRLSGAVVPLGAEPRFHLCNSATVRALRDHLIVVRDRL